MNERLLARLSRWLLDRAERNVTAALWWGRRNYLGIAISVFIFVGAYVPLLTLGHVAWIFSGEEKSP